jgi:hypothetical protein
MDGELLGPESFFSSCPAETIVVTTHTFDHPLLLSGIIIVVMLWYPPPHCYLKTVKFESSGAFGTLLGTWWQGLTHISQFYCSRLEHVEDVVSLNDIVWLNVIQKWNKYSTQQQSQSDYSDRRPRVRIKLSINDFVTRWKSKILGTA